MTFSQSLDNSQNNNTNCNTDNKGHLFVTVFEYTAFLYRDPYIAPPGQRTSARNKDSVT
jgi:D-arabinose 5-phosphate isomerase GutQ